MSTGVRLKFAESERVSLASHPDYDEAWLEGLIRDKVSILGLGNLEVLSSQKRQSKGRLDLLLRDAANQTNYVVELMLGTLDETHIVRTIEYWLRERNQKAKEDYDHVAVLAAENILGNRFVEVVRFLSEQMPLVLLEIRASRVENLLTVQFVTVFDGRDTEAGDTPGGEATRESWIEWKGRESILLTERFVTEILKPLGKDDVHLTFKKHFLGLRVGNRINNFIHFHPKRQFVRVNVRTSKSAELAQQVKAAGLEVLGDSTNGWLIFRLTSVGLEANKSLLTEIGRSAYEER